MLRFRQLACILLHRASSALCSTLQSSADVLTFSRNSPSHSRGANLIGPTSRGPSRTMGAISGGVAFPSQGKATPPNQHQGRGACKMATPPYYRLWYEFLQSLKARTSDSAMEIASSSALSCHLRSQSAGMQISLFSAKFAVLGGARGWGANKKN